jgi:hypothetical protein
MKTKTFTGKDERDLKVRIWQWRCDPSIVVKKRHPVEKLDPNMTPVIGNYAPLTARDTVSMKVDYDEEES